MLDKNELRKIFGREAYEVQLFKERGFTRKQCPHCGTYFWTLNPDRIDCGDTNCIGGYTFIGKGSGKSWDFHDTVKNWSKFFEDNGHTRITEYPTVARWRDDIEFTIASIACFQPNVLNGTIKPPANPLVLPQPCIRFGGKGFNDIDNVGRTGRHLTSFIMGGQHAFNSKNLGYKGYWMDRCIELDFKLLTQLLKIPDSKITLREDIWLGGGNFGPCLESFCDGLEIVNSVFMQYEVLPDDTYRQMDMTVVDVGWGVERVGWYATGTPTVYEATFGPVLTRMKDAVGIKIDTELLNKYYVLSGLLNVDEVDIKVERKKLAKELNIDYHELEKTLGPLEALYAIADHLRTLIYTISDGAIPSNIGGGYNLRTILRRAINLKDKHHFENLDLLEVCHWHIDYLQKTYKGVKNAEDSINDIFNIEQERYYSSIKKGRTHINEMIKKKVKFDEKKLITLYQSRGILPELVEQVAFENGIQIEIPGDFFALVEQYNINQVTKKKEITLEEKLKDLLKDIPNTQLLYYKDQYLDSCEAKILKILPEKNIILDRTIFYPLGGGQMHDEGLIGNNPVINVEKVGGIVIHQLEKTAKKIKEGDKVKIKIDKDRRLALMRHHTGTHIVNGAAKRVLGNHIWQAGAEKKPDIARLDITHYKPVSQEEIWEIERLANQVVMETRPVDIKFMPRGEAEAQYGFTLYQGGIVPGKEIRVIDIQDWDVEACGGTHLKNTGEIGLIKLISAKRIQDGIVRLEYTAGAAAVKTIQHQEKFLKDTAEVLETNTTELIKTAKRIFNEWKQYRKENKKLRKENIKLKEQLSKKNTIISSDQMKITETLTLFNDFPKQNLFNYLLKNHENFQNLLKIVKFDKYLNNHYLFKNSLIKDNLKITIRRYREKSTMELIEIGSMLVKEDPWLVAVLGSINQKMNLIIIEGEKAKTAGLHAGNLISRITEEYSGGGGGKQELGQGGNLPNLEIKELMEIIFSKILNESK